MTFKPISREAIPAALEKAQLYRLLNEPAGAESICLDILAIDAGNQAALVTMLLALTDQFRESPNRYADAKALLPKLSAEYERLYYGGLVRERRAYVALAGDSPGGGSDAHAWLTQAMGLYERAEAIRPAGNDDSLLRWNSCQRLIARFRLRPAEEVQHPPTLGED